MVRRYHVLGGYTVSLLSTLLAIASAVGFFALIMYVLFGQILVFSICILFGGSFSWKIFV